MPLRVYVSKNEASYFLNNSMSIASGPPTEGHHNVGDIVISSIQKESIFGWVCTESGTPGRWDVICDIIEIKNDTEMNRLSIEDIYNTIDLEKIRVTNIELIIDNIDKRVKTNENNIVNINAQMGLVNQSLVSLDDRLIRTNKNIDTLYNVVESNASSGTEITDNIQKDVNDLATLVNTNADAAITAAANLQKELNNLKNLVGANAEESTEADTNIIKEINDLKEIVGLNAVESNKADTNIIKEINDLKEIVGANADDANESATGLQKEINDLKEIVGANADDASESATGLQKEINDLKEIVGLNADESTEANNSILKEINDLKEFVGLGDNEGSEGGNNLLDQVGQSAEDISKLNSKTDTITTVGVLSPGVSSYGELISDPNASLGYSYQVTSNGASEKLLFGGRIMDDIKFGRYGFCIRMLCTSESGSVGKDLIRVKVVNGTQIILEKIFNYNDFSNNGQYDLLYGTFNYKPVNNKKNDLLIQIETLTGVNVTASFDYIYANMAIPSVFL